MPKFNKPSEALNAVFGEELEKIKRAAKTTLRTPTAEENHEALLQATGRILDSMQARFDRAIQNVYIETSPFEPKLF